MLLMMLDHGSPKESESRLLNATRAQASTGRKTKAEGGDGGEEERMSN